VEHIKLIDLHLFYHDMQYCDVKVVSKAKLLWITYKGCGICIEINSKLSLVCVIETLWLEKYHKHETCLYKIVLSYMNRSHGIFLR